MNSRVAVPPASLHLRSFTLMSGWGEITFTCAFTESAVRSNKVK
ncbi:hypothetical protein M075_3757 [Bacteroides fragilis str. 20793-3]|nr:hypothetical protein M078_3569 [Bacteroides fragilis str. 2-F-2 \